jgi:hypothetical protein
VRDSVPITCPHCGEAFEITIDRSDTGFITDCEVCCRPMTVTVRIADGEIESAETTPA